MTAEKANVLVVEDELNLHEALKLNLEMEGYEVTSAFDGNEALKKVENAYFDLIIMDVMLPELDGISVTESIRVHNNEVPILMLSAKNAPADKVLGLKKGADDYLTKPFNLDELLIRVAKLIGKNLIDFKAQDAITWNGLRVDLSKKEAMLLKLLIENKGEVVTREKILQVVWGYNVYPTTRTIDNFILSFRKYFEEDSRNPVYFHSVRGVGYKYTD